MVLKHRSFIKFFIFLQQTDFFASGVADTRKSQTNIILVFHIFLFLFTRNCTILINIFYENHLLQIKKVLYVGRMVGMSFEILNASQYQNKIYKR
jgi:hypothetical protein